MKGISKKERKIVKGYCFNKQLRDQPILWEEIQKHARTRDVYKNECKTSSEEESEKEDKEKEITINVACPKKPEPKTNEVKVKYDPDKKLFYLVNPGEYGYEPPEPPSIYNQYAQYSPSPRRPASFSRPSSSFQNTNTRPSFQNSDFQPTNQRGNFNSFRGSGSFRGQRMEYSSARGQRRRFPTPPRNGFIRCYNCNKIGHTSKVCEAPRICFVCGRTGHISTMCRERNNVSNEGSQERSNQVNNARSNRRDKSNL